MQATTAARPQAAAPRRQWTSKLLSFVMAGLVLSGYSATVLMRVTDSSESHGGCCGNLFECSGACLKDLPIDVRAAQTALGAVEVVKWKQFDLSKKGVGREIQKWADSLE
mgnify:FL=1